MKDETAIMVIVLTGIGRVHNVSIGVGGKGRGAQGSFVVIVGYRNARKIGTIVALAA